MTSTSISKKPIYDYPVIFSETIVSMIDAHKYFPVRPARVNLERWMRDGAGGVILETVKIGNRRYTSVEAITRFLYGRLRLPPGHPPIAGVTPNGADYTETEYNESLPMPLPMPKAQIDAGYERHNLRSGKAPPSVVAEEMKERLSALATELAAT
jgi:hypothetical protein